MLKLRIENFDQLADGGPLEFTADRRGFDFGRDQHLDWTLPDQSGVISRKHCEVRFFEQSYWLFDLSTNGTFVNRAPKRVASPYKLADGDELRIGDYIISVGVDLGGPRVAAGSSAPIPEPRRSPGAMMWDMADADAPPPVDPRDLMPPPPDLRRAPEYPYQHVHLPPVSAPAMDSFAPPSRAMPDDLWGTGETASGAPPPVPAAAVPAEPLFQPGGSLYQPMAVKPAAAPPPPVTPEPVVRAAAAAPGPSAPAVTEQDFVRRFAIGAGLVPDVLAQRDAGELAEELGMLFNLFCGHMMQLLNARAAAKTATRSTSRTLIQPEGNNPLKFMPTPEEALRVMLGRQSAGYLGAADTIEKSFGDLKNHQLALLSAMQQAASMIFSDISPDAVRKAADTGKKSLLGGTRGKYWESYVDIWNATAGKAEHGMLQAFLDAFAACYDIESQKPRGGD